MYRSKKRRLWTDPLDPETIGNWISRCGESTSDSNHPHFRRERSWQSTIDGKLFFLGQYCSDCLFRRSRDASVAVRFWRICRVRRLAVVEAPGWRAKKESAIHNFRQCRRTGAKLSTSGSGSKSAHREKLPLSARNLDRNKQRQKF